MGFSALLTSVNIDCVGVQTELYWVVSYFMRLCKSNLSNTIAQLRAMETVCGIHSENNNWTTTMDMSELQSYHDFVISILSHTLTILLIFLARIVRWDYFNHATNRNHGVWTLMSGCSGVGIALFMEVRHFAPWRLQARCDVHNNEPGNGGATSFQLGFRPSFVFVLSQMDTPP